MVGLQVVARKLKSAKRATPAGAAKLSLPPDQRLASQAPVTASSVLPTPMAAAAAIAPWVVILARNAPSRIAGATRYPRSSTAASASPVGGQIGVALGLIDASARPSFASAK